jgi:hypothetical protein
MMVRMESLRVRVRVRVGAGVGVGVRLVRVQERAANTDRAEAVGWGS